MGNQLGKLSITKETFTGTFPLQTPTPSKTTINKDDPKEETKKEDSRIIKYGTSSMQGWRPTMEDAHILQPTLYSNLKDEEKEKRMLLPGHALFAILDGHGGTFASQYTSQHLVEILVDTPSFGEYTTWWKKNLHQTNYNDEDEDNKEGNELLTQSFKEAFAQLDYDMLLQHQANLKGKKKNKRRRSVPSSGTTATIVLITPLVILCANAGDSRALLCTYSSSTSPSPTTSDKKDIDDKDHNNTATKTKNFDINMIPLSHDHKPSNLTEKSRILHSGGHVTQFNSDDARVDGILAVSRGLGDYEFKDAKLISSCKLLHYNNNDEEEMKKIKKENKTMISKLGSSQKVSPIPDVIVTCMDKMVQQQQGGGFVFIACDGVWDVFTNQECVYEIVKIVEKEKERNVGLVCEEILDLSLARGSTDNLSALLIQYSCSENNENTTTGGGGEGVMARRKRRLQRLKKNGHPPPTRPPPKQPLRNWSNNILKKENESTLKRQFSTFVNNSHFSPTLRNSVSPFSSCYRRKFFSSSSLLTSNTKYSHLRIQRDGNLGRRLCWSSPSSNISPPPQSIQHCDTQSYNNATRYSPYFTLMHDLNLRLLMPPTLESSSSSGHLTKAGQFAFRTIKFLF